VPRGALLLDIPQSEQKEEEEEEEEERRRPPDAMPEVLKETFKLVNDSSSCYRDRDSGWGTTGGGPGRPPFWSTPKESCKGLGSVS